MMRIGALVSGVMTAAAAAAPKKVAPQIWHFLGMPFEAPSMVAALFGCTVTRVIVGQSDKTSRWLVRVPVDVLTLGTTFVLVVERSPDVLAALALGIFVATLGATIIKVAERWGSKMLQVIVPDAAAPPPPPDPPAPPTLLKG